MMVSFYIQCGGNVQIGQNLKNDNCRPSIWNDDCILLM